MQAILFALITYLGWGTGDIFGTIAARKIGAASTTIWAFCLGIFLFSFYIPFTWNEIYRFTPLLLFITGIIGILIIVGNVSYNEALRIGNPSLVGTICASFTSLVVIFSVIFYKESLSSAEVVSICAIFFGVLLCTFHIEDIKKKNFRFDKSILLSFLTMFCWAIAFTLLKIPANKVGWFWPNYLTFLFFPIIFFYIKIKKIHFYMPTRKNALLPLIITTILLRGGDFAYNFAITKGYAAVVAPIAGAYATLLSILAFFVFRQPLHKQQITGIVITLVGIVALSFLSA